LSLFGDRFRRAHHLRRQSHYAQLLKHEQLVVMMPDHPDDLAALKAHSLDACEFHLAARRCNALEFPLVRAPDGQTHDHVPVFGQHILDGKMNIRVDAALVIDDMPGKLWALAGAHVLSKIGVEQIVQQRVVVAVIDLLKILPDNHFVVSLWRQRSTPYPGRATKKAGSHRWAARPSFRIVRRATCAVKFLATIVELYRIPESIKFPEEESRDVSG